MGFWGMRTSLWIFILEMSLLKRAENIQGRRIMVLFSDIILEKEQKMLPTGRHQYTSIFNSVVCFCAFFSSWSLRASSLIGIGAQGGISCCLLLNLNSEADGTRLCTDPGMGLKRSFQWSQKQTWQPTRSLAENPNYPEGGRGGELDNPCPHPGWTVAPVAKGCEVRTDHQGDEG